MASPYSVFPPERTGHQVPGSLPEYWAVTHPPACSSQSGPRVDRALCGCGKNNDQPQPRVGPAHVAPSSAQHSPRPTLVSQWHTIHRQLSRGSP